MDQSQHIERRPSRFVDENGVRRKGTVGGRGASMEGTFSTLKGSDGSIEGLWRNCLVLVLIGKQRIGRGKGLTRLSWIVLLWAVVMEWLTRDLFWVEGTAMGPRKRWEDKEQTSSRSRRLKLGAGRILRWAPKTNIAGSLRQS